MFDLSPLWRMFSELDASTLIAIVVFVGTISGTYFRLAFRVDTVYEKLQGKVDELESQIKRLLQDQRYEASEKFVAKVDLQLSLKEIKDEMTRLNALILQALQMRKPL